jgi:cytochrome c biogenesis protein CcmG/thiol:disulfide interchange protein DsbE
MLVLVAGAAVVAVVLSAGFGRDPTVVQSVLLDRPAPPLAGATLDGDRFDLGDHHGNVVLVNVWASWCGPCRQEYPVLEEADRELGARGLQIVGINTQDSDAEARAFLDELGGESYPSVVDPDGRIAVEWGTFGVPETFVVDRDGRLQAKVVGAVTREWIAANVVPLLDQP